LSCGNPPYSSYFLGNSFTTYWDLSASFLKKFSVHWRTRIWLPISLFKLGGIPILKISEEQKTLSKQHIHEKMMLWADLIMLKNDLIRKLHSIDFSNEALKNESFRKFHSTSKWGSQRINFVFAGAIGKEPVSNKKVDAPLQLKAPQDYASRISLFMSNLSQ